MAAATTSVWPALQLPQIWLLRRLGFVAAATLAAMPFHGMAILLVKWPFHWQDPYMTVAMPVFSAAEWPFGYEVAIRWSPFYGVAGSR